MNVLWVFPLILIFLFQAAQAAELEKGRLVLAGKRPLHVASGHLVPEVVDWNHDGKKDLLVGQRPGSRIRLYLNEGTNDEPLFTTSSHLEAQGKTIALESG